jgi:hypothetical protein
LEKKSRTNPQYVGMDALKLYQLQKEHEKARKVFGLD